MANNNTLALKYCRDRKRLQVLGTFAVYENCDDFITLLLGYVPTAAFYQFAQDAKFEPHGHVQPIEVLGVEKTITGYSVTLRKLPGFMQTTYQPE